MPAAATTLLWPHSHGWKSFILFDLLATHTHTHARGYDDKLALLTTSDIHINMVARARANTRARPPAYDKPHYITISAAVISTATAAASRCWPHQFRVPSRAWPSRPFCAHKHAHSLVSVSCCPRALIGNNISAHTRTRAHNGASALVSHGQNLANVSEEFSSSCTRAFCLDKLARIQISACRKTQHRKRLFNSGACVCPSVRTAARPHGRYNYFAQTWLFGRRK